MAHAQVSEAVCVGIAASDIRVRSFSVAVWSNLLTQIVRLEPLMICVRISERRNDNYFFSNEQFGSVFALAGAYVPYDIGNDTLTPVIL
jgi:hypothetical protein